MATRALLISGATGKQGGAVVNEILRANAGFEILALTRDAQSNSAKRLLQKSPKIKLVTGDFNSLDEVFRKAKEATSAPIWGVFSVQPNMSKDEEGDGKKLVDAALKNGVSHFVYTSAERAGEVPTNVPHFITKHNIEQHLFAKAKGSNMSWTVLRPVAFYDNFTPNFFGKVFTTSLLMRLGNHDKKIQLIGTSDIGWFAAQAFLNANKEEYKNKGISLAGDELTYDEMKNIFEKKTGETLPTTYAFIAAIIQWLSADFGMMCKWFKDVGFAADIPALRKMKPDMKDFGTWLDTESAWKKA